MAVLRITDASGRQTQYKLNQQGSCTIGRAPDNQVVLDDPRASRYHAHIKTDNDGSFMIVDGVVVNGDLKRSANKVFVIARRGLHVGQSVGKVDFKNVFVKRRHGQNLV